MYLTLPVYVSATSVGQASCTATYTIMDKEGEPVFDEAQFPSSSKTLETATFTILPKIQLISLTNGDWNGSTKSLVENINTDVTLPLPTIQTGNTSYNDWNQYKDFFTWKVEVSGTNSVTATLDSASSKVTLRRKGDISETDAKVKISLVCSDINNPLNVTTVAEGYINLENAVVSQP